MAYKPKGNACQNIFKERTSVGKRELYESL